MTTTISIAPLKQKVIQVSIIGVTPLICHRFSEKAKKQMRDKKAGIKTKVREKCDPEAEFEAARYVMSNGSDGFPATGFKNAILEVAHKDVGVPKTLIRKSLFIVADEYVDGIPIVKIISDKPVMREDVVRVGTGSADLRYRPEFASWSAVLTIEYDEENLTPDVIVSLIQRAGFGVGVGDWRPERDGEFGRFKLEVKD